MIGLSNARQLMHSVPQELGLRRPRQLPCLASPALGRLRALRCYSARPLLGCSGARPLKPSISPSVAQALGAQPLHRSAYSYPTCAPLDATLDAPLEGPKGAQRHRHTAPSANGPYGTRPHRHKAPGTRLHRHKAPSARSPISTWPHQHTAPSVRGPISSRPHPSKAPSAHGPISTRPYRPKAPSAQGPTSSRPHRLKAPSAIKLATEPAA